VFNAHQVALNMGRRVLQRIAHPRLGRQVNHPARPHRRKQLRHGSSIGNIKLVKLPAPA
jgi:hypothetical protein